MVIAIGSGYIGGVILSFYVIKLFLSRVSKRVNSSVKHKYLIKLIAVVFGVLALAPALFLATVVAGIAGSYGGIISSSFGLGAIGIPVGLTFGLILVTGVTVAVISFFGVALGIVVARVIYRGVAT